MPFWAVFLPLLIIGGLTALTILTRPRAPQTVGPRLDDTRVQTSTYGTAIPIDYGTIRHAGNVFDGDRELRETRKEEDNQVSFAYSVVIAVGWCEGEAQQIRRIWADGKLIWNMADPGIAPIVTGIISILGGDPTPKLQMHFYPGSETQTADPWLEEIHGAGNVPAYRGLCYTVFKMKLEDFGNRIPNLEAEIVKNASETFPLGTQLTVPVQNDRLILDPVRPYLYTYSTGGGWARINRHTGLVEAERTLSTVVQGTGISPDGFLFGHIGVTNYSGLAMMDAMTFSTVDGIGGSASLFSFGNSFTCRDDTIQNFGHQQAIIHPTVGQVVYDIGFGGQITALFYGGQIRVCYTGFEHHNPHLLSNGLPLGVIGFSQARWSSLVFGIGYASCVDKYGSLWVVSGVSTNDDDYGLTRVSLGLFFEPIFAQLYVNMNTTHWNLNGYLKRGNNGIMYDAENHQLILFGQNGVADDKTVTSLTRSGNTVTAIVPGHGMSAGNFVGIRGQPDTSFQGVFLIDTIPDGNTLTYTQEAADATTTGGVAVPYPQGMAKFDPLAEQSGIAGSFTGVSRRYGADVFMESAIKNGPANGEFIITTNGVTTRFRVDDLSVVKTYDLDDWSVTSRFGYVYDAQINALWVIQSGGKVQPYYLDRFDDDGITLDEIVRDQVGDGFNRAGMPSSEFDVTDLAGIPVRGVTFSHQAAVAENLEPLMRTFFFDCRETDGYLEFLRRGGASVLTIPEDDLGVVDEGAEAIPRLIESRVQELELPARVDINFFDVNQDYQTGTQTSQRVTAPNPTMRSRQPWTVEVPIVFTPTEARQIAEVIEYEAWTERMQYEFTTLPKHLRLDPADPITVEYKDQSLDMRVNRPVLGAGLSVKVEAVACDPEVYTRVSLGAEGGYVPQAIPYPRYTELILMDTPLLTDEHWNNAFSGFYAAFGAVESGWESALLWRSEDGQSYQNLTGWTEEATWGRAEEALATVDNPWTWDRVNTVIVQVMNGKTLTTRTEDDILDGTGKNMAVLGGEVIQFVTATDLGDGRYELSTLLRGKRGSEQWRDLHFPGESFVLVDTTILLRQKQSLSEIGDLAYYKAVSRNGSFAATPFKTFTLLGNDLRPYAPVSIEGTRAGDDLTIDWIRRTRVGGQWGDFSEDVPLGEDSEAYEIDILDGSTVVRTLTATDSEVEYTGAMQTADFGSPQTEVDVLVYQMSAQVGRGFAGSATV